MQLKLAIISKRAKFKEFLRGNTSLKKQPHLFVGETTPFGMMIKLKYPKVHGSFIMYLVLFTKLTMITKILVGNYYSSAKRMRLSKILSRILKLNLKITMSILN